MKRFLKWFSIILAAMLLGGAFGLFVWPGARRVAGWFLQGGKAVPDDVQKVAAGPAPSLVALNRAGAANGEAAAGAPGEVDVEVGARDTMARARETAEPPEGKENGDGSRTMLITRNDLNGHLKHALTKLDFYNKGIISAYVSLQEGRITMTAHYDGAVVAEQLKEDLRAKFPDFLKQKGVFYAMLSPWSDSEGRQWMRIDGLRLGVIPVPAGLAAPFAGRITELLQYVFPGMAFVADSGFRFPPHVTDLKVDAGGLTVEYVPNGKP